MGVWRRLESQRERHCSVLRGEGGGLVAVVPESVCDSLGEASGLAGAVVCV